MSRGVNSLRGDVRDCVRTLEREGWTFDGFWGSGHVRMVWPATGQQITVPASPSDHRSLPNTLADARRLAGVERHKHRSPRYRAVRGSGFDLDTVADERRERARLLDRLHDIENQLRGMHARRDRARAISLARQVVELRERLGLPDPA